jgi:peptidyl-prolyl cis-trans isomerase B (cyclophilin B)
VASTKDRQRALERARYERVQAKMQKKHREAKRKQRIAIVSSVAAIAVIAAVVLSVVATSGSSSSKTPAASSTGSAAPSASASATSSAAANPLKYEASGTSAVKGITIPTFDAATAEKTYTVTLTTNRGNIVLSLDGKAAPYTVDSFVYLASKGYFNNSKCHRLVWSSGLYMLQCGDPTGTGQGGPGYTIPDENLASLGAANSSGTVTYKAGTIAMANTGQPHTGGSQFFLVGENTTALNPAYTPFGTITQGLNILQSIGAAGAEAADSNGTTAPKDATTIEKVTATAQG